MATNITVTTTERHVEKRDWLLEAEHHVQVTGTLDVSTLTLADDAPLGMIPSGMALRYNTGNSLWEVHDPTPTTGDEQIDGVLYDTCNVSALTDPDFGIPVMIHGFVRFDKLPKSTDTPARVSANRENGAWGATLAAARTNAAAGNTAGLSSLLVLCCP